MQFVYESLRLRNWLLALIPIACLCLFSLVSPIYVRVGSSIVSSDIVKSQFSASEIAEFKTIRSYLAYLAPLTGFGMLVHFRLTDAMREMSGLDSGDDFTSSMAGMFGGGATGLMGSDIEIFTSLAAACLAVFAGLFITGVITKDSRSALFTVLPFILYCLLLLVYVNMSLDAMIISLAERIGGPDAMKDIPPDALAFLKTLNVLYWPYAGKLLAVAVLAGVAARYALMLAGSTGRLALADVRAGAAVNVGGVLDMPGLPQSAPGAYAANPAVLAGQQAAVDKKLEYACVCPFCGNKSVNRNAPGVCKRCNRNIGVMTERADGQRCEACDGVLVRQAHFCHHCGLWLGAQEGAVD